MNYANSANTAAKYFLLLGDRIMKVVELSPDGICDSDDIQLYMNRTGTILTDVGLKAHKWVMSQLLYFNNEYWKGRMSEAELIEMYSLLNLEGYIRYAAWQTRKEVQGKWESRVIEYDLKGDAASKIYCLRRLELLAIAASQGTTVKEIFKRSGWEGYLDREIGPIQYEYVDKDLLSKFGREAWRY